MKQRLLIGFLLMGLMCLTACGKTKTNETVAADKTNDTISETILEKTSEASDSIFVSNIKDKQLTVSSDNIETDALLVEKTRALDKAIQTELDSGSYTWENPMVIVNPYKNAPLTALILFQTQENAYVRVTVKGKTKKYDIKNKINELKTAHRVPVIGLYADYENTVLLELIDKNENVIKKQTLKIQTDSLPELMDNMVTVKKHTAKSAYNLTIVTGQSCIYPFAYDESGEIRWIMTKKGGSNGIFPLSNGRYIYQTGGSLVPSHEKPHPSNLFEMDYLGRAYRQYFVEQGVHHDVTEKTPGGNLMIITNSNEEYVEDVVMELDRKTGAVVKKLNLKDVLGTYFRNQTDWVHTNTISYDKESDTVLLSPRNTHSAIKVNWTTGELIWILGNPEIWKGSGVEDKVLQPKGDIQWHFQQHAVYEIDLADGKKALDYYIMFDNHWNTARKVDCFDNLPDSYTLIYAVDEKAFTVSQEKVFTGVKSKITSNSIYDKESRRVFAMSGNLKKASDSNWGMNYEYDYKTGKVLNQYAIKERFYRGYEMIYNYEDMSQPVEIYKNYLGGNLTNPVNVTENISEYTIPNDMLTEEISFKIQSSVLYMYAGDHAVQRLIFVGQNNCYVYDKSHITLYDKSFLTLSYYTPIPLSGLNEDTYTITVVYNNHYYNTGKSVTISKNQ